MFLIIVLGALSAIAPTSLAHSAFEQKLIRPESSNKHLSLTHDLVEFHKNLTQIESITGNEHDVGQWLVSSLKSQGYNIETQYVTEKPPRFNILAWPGATRDAHVLLSSHIDTVSANS